MFKFNKENTLEFKHKNNNPSLPSNSEGKTNGLKIEKIKQSVRLKKIQNINEMQITYEIIKKKN